MAITSKIKSMLLLKGKTSEDLADYLGISKQAVYNKFNRDSYSADDLIKIADFLEMELAFIVDSKQRFTLETDDIKAATKKQSENT